MAQLVRNPPPMQETWVWSLGWKDPLVKGNATTPVCWPGEFHGLYSPCGLRRGDHTPLLYLMSSSGEYCQNPIFLLVKSRLLVWDTLATWVLTSLIVQKNLIPRAQDGNMMIILLKVAPLKSPSLMSTYDTSYHLVSFWLIVFPQWKCLVWGVDYLVSSVDYSFRCL